MAVPRDADTHNKTGKRQAASTQFARAEELRAQLNSKPADKRKLSEYKQVVSSYRRVYLITPHAAEVPDALLAVAELYTEMGDRFGRSYYQLAADSYQFLLHQYPTSHYGQDAMLRVARLITGKTRCCAWRGCRKISWLIPRQRQRRLRNF